MGNPCQSDICNVMLQFVVPSCACITALLLFLAPVPAVLIVVKSRKLATLNTLPFALLNLNCLGWMAYGLLVKDYFVFVPNLVGWVIAMYCVLMTYPLTSEAVQQQMMHLLVVVSGVLFLVSGVSIISIDYDKAKVFMGITTNLVLVGFLASPLSTFVQVIKTRDSSSLNIPLAFASLVNSSLWFVYGIAIQDGFIYAPNGLGILLAVAQLVLIWKYPRSKTVSKKNSGADLGEGDSSEHIALSHDRNGSITNNDSPRVSTFHRPDSGQQQLQA